MIGFSIAALVAAVPIAYLIMERAYGFYGVLVTASVLAFLTTGIYGVIPAYLSEKFSTDIRSTGVGFSFNGGFIIGNWSTAILLLLTSMTSAAFYAYWGAFIVVGELFILASALMSPETRGAELG